MTKILILPGVKSDSRLTLGSNALVPCPLKGIEWVLAYGRFYLDDVFPGNPKFVMGEPMYST